MIKKRFTNLKCYYNIIYLINIYLMNNRCLNIIFPKLTNKYFMFIKF